MQSLVAENVQTIFGYPGGAIMPIYDALYDYKNTVNHILVRHEQGAIHAAQGYARTSGKTGVVFATSGPGATNLITGLADALIDSTPLVCITGQVASHLLGTDAFQETDVVGISMPITKWNCQVTKAEEIPAAIAKAFYIAQSGRPGPVLIDIPLDIQQAEIEFDIDSYHPLSVETPETAKEDIDKALDLLSQAKSPVLIMGGGVVLSHCEREVTAFAESLNIPIITTFMAKGGLPIEHPLNAGHAGIQVGQPIGNSVLLESDVVLGIGCRFTDRHTGDLKVYRGERKFIHIDIEPSQIGKVFKPDLGIVSDAGKAVAALSQAAKNCGMKPFPIERINELQKKRSQLARRTDYSSNPIMPHRLFQEINQAFDADTIFTVGCGNTQIWAGQLQQIDKPRKFLPSGGAGTLGYEIPGAFGAKVACPDTTCVTILGDFGFTFMGEEIAVASVYQKPIIIVILNNSNLGLIRQNQKGAYGFEHAIDMCYNCDGRIDYVKVAEGFGCRAKRVFSHDELRETLQEAKAANQTFLIDVVCVSDQMCDMGANIANIKSWAPAEKVLN